MHATTARLAGGFRLDLGPFLAAWASGAPEHGIAVVPDPTANGPTSSWHVAFNGRNLAAASHITSVFSPAPAASTTTGPVAGSPAAPPEALRSSSRSAPAPIDVGGPSSLMPPAASSLAGGSPAASPSPAAPAGGTRTVFYTASSGGFQYPEILLLPLVLTGAVVFLLRLLTGDATPAELLSAPPEQPRPKP